MSDPQTEARDQLLDELTEALEDWHSSEVDAINKEAAFVQSVIKGRASSVGLASGNVERARILVIDDITSFLAGL